MRRGEKLLMAGNDASALCASIKENQSILIEIDLTLT